MTQRFVGTWRLVSFVGHAADGREKNTYGSKPLGFVMYDKGGRMSVQIAPTDRKAAQSGAAFEGYFGYFGTYTVDEKAGAVTHHVEGSSAPALIGTDQRRFFSLEKDRLVLTAPREQMDGEFTYVATWEKA